MRLEISHGEIILVSDHQDTRLTISPRRSTRVGHTTITLTSSLAHLAPLEFAIEEERDPERARAWVWSGDPPSALRLADRVLAHLHRHFAAPHARAQPWASAFLRAFPLAASRLVSDPLLVKGSCAARANP
jgi:hypothetical protein